QYPNEEAYFPCPNCDGLGYSKKDDSKDCKACNATGDGRYRFYGNRFTGEGVWSGPRGLKKPTGAELRLARRVSLWLCLFFGAFFGLFFYIVYHFLMVGFK